MKFTFAMLCVLSAAVLSAAPAGKTELVAEGYPDWQGVTAKNYFMGRELCPSDLRHKATVVVDIEPNDKLQDQLVRIAKLVDRTGRSRQEFGANWETLELPRDVIVIISNCGSGKDKDHEAIKEALKYKGDEATISEALATIRSMGCSIYDGITFTGAPDSAGKRPFVYVMGPEGKEPLCQGELNDAMVKTANAAITKAKKQVEGWEIKWRPFYGNIDEPKFFPQIAKSMEKGKPLAPLEKVIQKDVVAKDPERAKEAQILYDALCQTRSDLVMRIKLEVAACPHRAYYDIQQLVKYWPSERKRLEAAYAKIKTIPEAEKLAKMFMKLKAWAEPEFTCKNAGEAKKIVAELNKMKKDLEKMKESKVIVIQNGALLMDTQVDELISLIPAKVPSK